MLARFNIVTFFGYILCHILVNEQRLDVGKLVINFLKVFFKPLNSLLYDALWCLKWGGVCRPMVSRADGVIPKDRCLRSFASKGRLLLEQISI